MASMTRLRRRALRWRRYEARYYDCALAIHEGAKRALRRVEREQFRRNPYHGYGPCFCVGCIGHGRCEHDDPEDFDDSEFFCGDPGCSCGDAPDDDAGHGDDWPGVVTVAVDRGLL